MFCFGIAINGLLYHNIDLSWTLLRQVFFPAYFIIAGEYFTRTVIMDGKQKYKLVFNLNCYIICFFLADSCEVNDTLRVETDFYSLDDCPDKHGAGAALALYVFYIIFLNILLVNLIIAIFSYVVTKLI